MSTQYYKELTILHQRVAQLEQKLSLLVEFNELAVIEWNTALEVIEWNPAAEIIFGYSKSEAKANQISKVIIPESGKFIEGLLQGKVSSISQNYTKDGKLISCKWHNILLIDGTIISLVENISQRQAAKEVIQQNEQFQNALIESEAKFRRYVEQANDLIYEHTLDSIFTYVSPRCKDILGYELQELIGKSFIEFVHPEDLPACQAFLNLIIETDSKQTGLEIRAKHKNGSWNWLACSTSSVKDADGNIISFQGLARDINQQKFTEAALQQKNLQYQSIFDAVGDGIFVTELEQGKVLEVNLAACQMHGYTREEMKSLLPATWVHPDSHHLFYKYLEVGRTGEIFKCEAVDVRKDGTLFDVEVKATPYIHNHQLHILAVVRDISDRKLAEQAIKEQARLAAFRAAIDHTLTKNNDLQKMLEYCTEVMINYLDVSLARIWILNNAENVLQLQASTGVETYINDKHICVPIGKYKIGIIAKQHQPYFTNALESDPRVSNVEWVRKEKLKSFAGYPLLVDQELVGVVAIFSQKEIGNSTLEELAFVANEMSVGIKRIQAEVQLRQQTQYLAETLTTLQRTQAQLIQNEKMSSLGQLVAGVAHEINNPVNFIYGNLIHAKEYTQEILNLVELYQKYYPQPVAEVQEVAELIDLKFLMSDLPKILTSMKIGTDRIKKIVTSLRIFSRMDEAEYKEVDIHEGIDSTLMILENRLKGKSDRSTIKVIREYGTLPLIVCYAGQLNQVFMNILTNAIDALEEGIDNIHEPKISIRTEIANERVIIRIADNGPGMTSTVQKRLFDPFFTTKEVGKGTGMGLSISYQIITERHGGSLYCTSSPGQGAEFVIEIPKGV
jgi:hypothetical protein